MFHNLKKRLRFARFDFEIRAILDTPAIKCANGSDIVCVSHIGSTYLSAYLLAIKSLARWVPLRKVIIVDDLSLTDRHKAVLREHIPGVDVRPITSIRNQSCPSGGDWEGFLLIGEEAKDRYCILLDADTVATGSLPEVLDSIANNKSFTLGTWKNQQIVSVTEAYEYVKSLQSGHVQIVAEKSLHKMNNAAAAKYVRGCGGFAGFAKGKDFRHDIEEFSRHDGTDDRGRKMEGMGQSTGRVELYRCEHAWFPSPAFPEVRFVRAGPGCRRGLVHTLYRLAPIRRWCVPSGGPGRHQTTPGVGLERDLPAHRMHYGLEERWKSSWLPLGG